LGLTHAVTSALIACLVQNAKDAQKIKNLEKVMSQLGDEFLVLIYKTMKNSADKTAMSNILINTRETYNRIVKYTKNNED